jgi:hypothetical protein
MKAVSVIVIEAGKSEGFMQSYPESPSLADMQGLVGGYIELVHLNDKQYMVVNEDGHSMELPYNKVANELLAWNRPEFAKLNTIVGNVFLIDKKDVQ